MPVTARLSKRFYEVLGEDVANELVDWFNAVDSTYRSDLRELNELNFARFDAKLEQRVSQIEAKIEQRVSQVEARLEAKMDRVEARLEVALHELKADLLKWMFGAWATLLAAMIALITLG